MNNVTTEELLWLKYAKEIIGDSGVEEDAKIDYWAFMEALKEYKSELLKNKVP